MVARIWTSIVGEHTPVRSRKQSVSIRTDDPLRCDGGQIPLSRFVTCLGVERIWY